MRFNVFVRFKGEKEFCHWPVMQSRRNRRDYYVGGIGEQYPTEYGKRAVGAAVAFALRNPQVAQAEVRQAHDPYDTPDDDGGSLNGCPGDVAARDSL